MCVEQVVNVLEASDSDREILQEKIRRAVRVYEGVLGKGFIFNRKKKVSKDGTNVDIIDYSNDDNRTWEPVTESGKYLEEMTEYIDGIFPCREEKSFVFHEARFPHEYKTWFGVGHTLPNNEDYDPLGEGTEMGGFFFLPVISLGEDYPGVDAMICKDGTKINFLWAIPMYKEEIERYALAVGG